MAFAGGDPAQTAAPHAIGTIAPSLVFREAGLASGSVSLRNQPSGVIEISGVARPAKAAFVYWAVVTKGPPSAQAKTISIQRLLPGRSAIANITGTMIGSGPGHCGNAESGGGTLTVYRGAVPAGIADGDGSYVIRPAPAASGSTGGEDPRVSSPLPAWNNASLAVIGTGSGTVGLYDAGLAGRSIVNDAGVDYALSLGGGFGANPRLTWHDIGTYRWNGSSTVTGRAAQPALKPAAGKLGVHLARPQSGSECLAPMANAVTAEPGAAASPRALLPDLVVSTGAVTSSLRNNVIAGRQSAEFDWTQRTANTGSAQAARSVTGVRIGTVTVNGATAQIPKLAKGKVSPPSLGNFEQDFTGWPFGTHRLKICADTPQKITEKNEDNNCRNGEVLHYVPKRFKGTVVGSNLLFGTVYLKWFATVDAEYANAAADGEKITARYDLKNVEVVFVFSGEINGCKYSGTATDKPRGQRIRVTFSPGAGSFTANNLASPNFTVPLRIKCPDAPPLNITHFDGSFAWFALNETHSFNNPGLESLTGKETFGSTKTSWTLTAHDQ